MRLIIGTRGSRLALAQTNYVKDLLGKRFPELEFKFRVIKTTGDKIKDAPLAKIGGKGIFVKEIDEAVARGKVDLAVHSMKDVPTELMEGLVIAAVPEREEPCDVLVSRNNRTLDELPGGAVIGTSSLRRRAEIMHYRRDITVKDIRGNVDTRLRKLRCREYDALIMAKAGLKRMGFEDVVTQKLSVDDFLPAVGQGAIAIVARSDCKHGGYLEGINHWESFHRTRAERAFLKRLGGGCQVPMGAYTEVENRLRMKAAVFSQDGGEKYEAEIEGRLEEAGNLGRKCAEMLLKKGAGKILDRFY